MVYQWKSCFLIHHDDPIRLPFSICSLLMNSLSAVFVADLEWKLTYVGSAEDETYDQLLESVLVGPVNVGNYRFVLQVTPGILNEVSEFMGYKALVISAFLIPFRQIHLTLQRFRMKTSLV